MTDIDFYLMHYYSDALERLDYDTYTHLDTSRHPLYFMI